MADSFLARFGGDDVERSLARRPKPATCIPTDTVVSLQLLENKDPSIIIFPSCTRVKQCGGCCVDNLLSCQPTATQSITFEVNFPINPFDLLLCYVLHTDLNFPSKRWRNCVTMVPMRSLWTLAGNRWSSKSIRHANAIVASNNITATQCSDMTEPNVHATASMLKIGTNAYRYVWSSDCWTNSLFHVCDLSRMLHLIYPLWSSG